MKSAHGEFIIILDCDLSHHVCLSALCVLLRQTFQPKEIPKMIQLQKKQNLDIVTGSRYRPGGGVCGWNFWRKLTSSGANVIAAVSIGGASSDMTGSFRFVAVNRIY